MLESNIRPTSLGVIPAIIDALRPAIERALASLVGNLRREIRSHQIHIDSIKLVSPHPIHDWLEAKLKLTTTGDVFVVDWPSQWRDRCILWAHQPTLATIEGMRQYLPRAVIGHLAIALTMNAGSIAAADYLHAVLAYLLLQRWHGSRIVSRVGDDELPSLYLAPRGSRRNAILYRWPRDEPPRPHLRLEARYENSRGCQQRDFHYPNDLDPALADPIACVLHEHSLGLPDWPLIGRDLDRKARRLILDGQFTDLRYARQHLEAIIIGRRDRPHWPSWSAFQIASTQDVVDALRPLRRAAVIMPFRNLLAASV